MAYTIFFTHFLGLISRNRAFGAKIWVFPKIRLNWRETKKNGEGTGKNGKVQSLLWVILNKRTSQVGYKHKTFPKFYVFVAFL